MPAYRVWHQHLHYELFNFHANLHIVRKGIETTSYSLVQLLGIAAFKRELAAEHGVQHDTACPNVSRLPIVVTSLHDLWTHVAWSATEHFKFGVVVCIAAEAKVDELDLAACVDDDVLKLYVTVSYFVLMQVVYCL